MLALGVSLWAWSMASVACSSHMPTLGLTCRGGVHVLQGRAGSVRGCVEGT